MPSPRRAGVRGFADRGPLGVAHVHHLAQDPYQGHSLDRLGKHVDRARPQSFRPYRLVRESRDEDDGNRGKVGFDTPEQAHSVQVRHAHISHHDIRLNRPGDQRSPGSLAALKREWIEAFGGQEFAPLRARLDEIHAAIRSGRLFVALHMHAGDGNVHYTLSRPDPGGDDAFKAHYAELNRIVHDIATGLNGSISAEHGIGQLKRGELVHYKNPVAIEMMRALKATLDPKGIMNPGKLGLE